MHPPVPGAPFINTGHGDIRKHTHSPELQARLLTKHKPHPPHSITGVLHMCLFISEDIHFDFQERPHTMFPVQDTIQEEHKEESCTALKIREQVCFKGKKNCGIPCPSLSVPFACCSPCVAPTFCTYIRCQAQQPRAFTNDNSICRECLPNQIYLIIQSFCSTTLLCGMQIVAGRSSQRHMDEGEL